MSIRRDRTKHALRAADARPGGCMAGWGTALAVVLLMMTAHGQTPAQEIVGCQDPDPMGWLPSTPPVAARYSLEDTPLFRSLEHAREVYRRLAGHEAGGPEAVHPEWSKPLPPLPGGKLAPGDAYAGLATLARRLAALGDLPPEVALPVRYEGALVEAVRRFQRRHGLTVDGVVGRATLAALEVTPAERLQQIERNIARLREAPPLRGKRAVLVNLPEFALRLYERRDGRWQEQDYVRVIIGKAPDHTTPLFDEDIAYVEFNPYWNIPRSIAVRETLPRLRRDPGYFDRAGLEAVMPDGRIAQHFSEELLQAVASGGARLRQRPGPDNAMGDIKFILPNNSGIYLHHTPSVGLFERSRRDFSHGCIRVEKPVALANFVLADPVSWPPARIIEAMRAGQNRTLRLPAPVQVLVVYSTVAENEGVVHFFPDVYGYDSGEIQPGQTRGSGEATSRVRKVEAERENVDMASGWRLRPVEPFVVHEEPNR